VAEGNAMDDPIATEPDDPADDLRSETRDRETIAFSDFCVHTMPSLLRIMDHSCRRLGVSPSFAEDAVQEAFIRGIRQYHDDPTKMPLPWLVRVGQNFLHDQARRERRWHSSDELAQIPECPDEENHHGFDDELWAAFAKLRPDDRTIIELILLEDLAPEAVAPRLGISLEATYKRYQRALKRLRELLEPQNE